MSIRRVVTGHNSEGKAIFASDESVDPINLEILPATDFYRLWGSDEAVRFPGDGSEPSGHQYFPGVGGFRFGVFTVAPDSVTLVDDIDFDAALVEMENKLPGLGAHLEPDNPGMHTTSTVDFEYVVSGQCILELDDGETRELGPGDTVIQNGTRHAWRNPYDEPCLMVVVLIGAHHDSL